MRCVTRLSFRSQPQFTSKMTAFSDSRKSQLQLMKQSPCFNSFGRASAITRSEMTHVYRKGDGVIHWNLERISTPDGRYAVMLLNNERSSCQIDDEGKFFKLWSNAAIRVAVDGGANYLPREHKFKPDIIAGDLDSVDKETLDFFTKIGTRIIHTPDQNETDFTKAIQKVMDERDSRIEYVIAFSSIGGRPDHVLSNFHTLFLFIKKLPVIILDNGVSISFALEAGVRHVIASPADSSAWCSLAPLMEPAVLTTTGLKWNLTGEILRFGQFISTSNEFAVSGGYAEVESSSCVLWSMKDTI